MNKCWLVVKKSGNRYRIDSKQAHMTSLELVKRLMDMNAFTPLYRNDTDVDIAGVFHYVHNKQDIQQLGFTEDKHCKLMSEKKPKKEINQRKKLNINISMLISKHVIIMNLTKKWNLCYVYKILTALIRKHLLEMNVASKC